MRTSWGASPYICTLGTYEVWFETLVEANPSAGYAGSVTHAEFLRGANHDEVRRCLGEATLQEVLQVVAHAREVPQVAEARARDLALWQSLPHEVDLASLPAQGVVWQEQFARQPSVQEAMRWGVGTLIAPSYEGVRLAGEKLLLPFTTQENVAPLNALLGRAGWLAFERNEAVGWWCSAR